MQVRTLGGRVRLVSCAGLVFSLITAVAVAAGPPVKQLPRPDVCRDNALGAAAPVKRFGTAIRWAKDTATATSEATRQGKVVFVMHISGNFRKLTFT